MAAPVYLNSVPREISLLSLVLLVLISSFPFLFLVLSRSFLFWQCCSSVFVSSFFSTAVNIFSLNFTFLTVSLHIGWYPMLCRWHCVCTMWLSLPQSLGADFEGLQKRDGGRSVAEVEVCCMSEMAVLNTTRYLSSFIFFTLRSAELGRISQGHAHKVIMYYIWTYPIACRFRAWEYWFRNYGIISPELYVKFFKCHLALRTKQVWNQK